MTKSFSVIRTHVSPYQDKNFISREKLVIESHPSLKYQTLAGPGDEPTILITNTHTQLKDLPARLLQNTKLIIHPNSGYDHFADEEHIWRHIPLVVGHTIRAQSVAEYSLGALFEGLLELPQHMMWHKERTWGRTLLKGTSVWIFGYGHIGKIIANTLNTLGMKVTVVDPFERSPYEHFSHWKEGKLREARVIISAMSLNAKTKYYFNDDFFTHCRPEVLFINGARGKLVREEALKYYLQKYPESFAFLDVFEKEPFGQEWHGFPQVWKTSHIAGVEKNLDDKILDFEMGILTDYLELPETNFFAKYKRELIQNKWKEGVLV
jgi:D-3-phosphoglycerate dehydrogenase